jgi:putative endonuclease
MIVYSIMAKHNEIGKVGEDIACLFLKKNGYDIIDRNFTMPFGEIDIVARENKVFHFIEVKTVTRENNSGYSINNGEGRPEENVDYRKIKALSRTINVYLDEHRYITNWTFDVIGITLNELTHNAQVNHMQNLELPE